MTTQAEALQETVDNSPADVPAALLELAMGLAAAVDAEPKNASLWREYRAAVDRVMEVVDDSPDDAVAEFRVSIETPRVRTKVRNRKDSK